MASGDRLEVVRRVAGSTVTYAHQGIDVGDGTVVHARPDDFRHPFGGGRVVQTSLDEFSGGDAVRVRHDPPPAFPPAEIVARALAHLGREGYCPVVDNCEHFATWCATGQRMSRQVDIVVGRVVAAASRVTAAMSGRIAVRAVAGTTVRLGLGTLVPAALMGEAVALAAEWRAHQSGAAETTSRRAGEAAGLTVTACACGTAGLPAGLPGVVAGGLVGAAIWLAGSAAATAAAAADRVVRRERR